MRTIKKYSNRRLYDTTDSRYVNLDDLAVLIRGGEQVRVLDAKSDADLTRDVLLQVLLEAQDGARLFPPGLLHRIIRFGGDHPLQRAALQQVGAGLELLDAQVSQLERSMGWMGAVPGAQRPAAAPAAPTGAPAAAPPPDDEPDDIDDGAPSFAAEGSSPYDARPADPAAGELDALREKLAALEARLKR